MRSPVVAGIIGALRIWKVAMISALAMPCRWMDVTARLVCPNLAPDDVERDALGREFDVCLEPQREVLST
jgi:hypothetical protein